MLGLIKVIAAAMLALVLWWALSAASIVPPTSPQEPPRPPNPIPAPASPTASAAPAPASPTASAAPAVAPMDVAKLNDTINKLTAVVDKLNQRLADRDPPAKPSGSSSPPSPPTSDTPRRQEIYARQTSRRSFWRDPPWWR